MGIHRVPKPMYPLVLKELCKLGLLKQLSNRSYKVIFDDRTNIVDNKRACQELADVWREKEKEQLEEESNHHWYTLF